MDSQRAVTIAGSRDAARANPDGKPNADARANPDAGAKTDAGILDAALVRACAILADAGVRARVECAGHARDVLVIHAPLVALPILHSASDELRALGFRYVTIDVTNA